MWSILLPFVLKAAGKAIAIGAGSAAAIAAQHGIDTLGAGAINDALVALGGLAINEGVDWFQKQKARDASKENHDSNVAKIEIIAEKTGTIVPKGTIKPTAPSGKWGH
jgi:hypothetical protein